MNIPYTMTANPNIHCTQINLMDLFILFKKIQSTRTINKLDEVMLSYLHKFHRQDIYATNWQMIMNIYALCLNMAIQFTEYKKMEIFAYVCHNSKSPSYILLII